MTSAWLLPEHLADVLPSEARRIETLRRRLIDRAGVYGFELVIPPLLEHLDALLSGTGESLDLETFKLVDQLSGRAIGLRPDTTPQVARIDAHLLNREGVTRLCYCGPVVHTVPQGPWASREPLQFGAEVYGHAGLEADLEVLDLALDALSQAQITAVMLDLSDVRVARGLLRLVDPAQRLDAEARRDLQELLVRKDAAGVDSWLAVRLPDSPLAARQALKRLTRAQGDWRELAALAAELPPEPGLQAALADLQRLGARLSQAHPAVRVSFDLSDLGGHAYYSGTRFSLYAPGAGDALVRGGRYDEVGSVFGRRRPAVGFSLDLKALVRVAPAEAPRRAVRAPWGEGAELRSAIRELREQGHTVVCVLPGHEHEAQEYDCDRELVQQGDAWTLRPLQAQPA
jgi:ATP phosphoribosyltransferase regulatory subunit